MDAPVVPPFHLLKGKGEKEGRNLAVNPCRVLLTGYSYFPKFLLNCNLIIFFILIVKKYFYPREVRGTLVRDFLRNAARGDILMFSDSMVCD